MHLVLQYSNVPQSSMITFQPWYFPEIVLALSYSADPLPFLTLTNRSRAGKKPALIFENLVATRKEIVPEGSQFLSLGEDIARQIDLRYSFQRETLLF